MHWTEVSPTSKVVFWQWGAANSRDTQSKEVADAVPASCLKSMGAEFLGRGLMRTPTILLTRQGVADRSGLRRELLRLGFEVVEVDGGQGVLNAALSVGVDLIVAASPEDGGWAALRLAEEIRRSRRSLPTILIVSEGSEKLAVSALKLRIDDYFKEPFAPSEVAASVKRLLLLREQDHSATPNPGPTSCDSMVGHSAEIQKIKSYILKVAITDSTVLITGETGTGKELVAGFIHNNSLRKQKAFVCLNCAAIPEALLESELFGYEKGAFTGAGAPFQGKLGVAASGTIFLDEIGDLTPYGQAKILRLVEAKEVQRLGAIRKVSVDVRIITATNTDIDQLAAEGRFRKDLYFRLNVGRVHLPPLRHRKADIPPLLRYYTDLLNCQLGRSVEGFSSDATQALLKYDWPGNIRELRNVLERVFVTAAGPIVTLPDLPEPFHRRGGYGKPRLSPALEKELLLSALSSTNWNRTKAAGKLNWSRMKVYRKMKKYSVVNPPDCGTCHEPSFSKPA
jgi:DNA-binding NtrC family response regulator